MARRVFYSFHHKPDSWRASQVRNMGVIEGDRPVSDNDWETIKRGGDLAIERWIIQQMTGKSCTVVLVGSSTANRKWINYEIIKTWNDGNKGLLGVYVHNLEDSARSQAPKGENPFDYIKLGNGPTLLSSIVRAYDPPFLASNQVYAHINANLAAWVEEAITLRSNH